MRLYKEYKQEQEAVAKLERDKEKISAGSETIIIYEKTGLVRILHKFIRNLVMLFLFIIILIIVTAGITAIVMWFKGV